MGEYKIKVTADTKEAERKIGEILKRINLLEKRSAAFAKKGIVGKKDLSPSEKRGLTAERKRQKELLKLEKAGVRERTNLIKSSQKNETVTLKKSVLNEIKVDRENAMKKLQNTKKDTSRMAKITTDGQKKEISILKKGNIAKQQQEYLSRKKPLTVLPKVEAKVLTKEQETQAKIADAMRKKEQIRGAKDVSMGKVIAEKKRDVLLKEQERKWKERKSFIVKEEKLKDVEEKKIGTQGRRGFVGFQKSIVTEKKIQDKQLKDQRMFASRSAAESKRIARLVAMEKRKDASEVQRLGLGERMPQERVSSEQYAQFARQKMLAGFTLGEKREDIMEKVSVEKGRLGDTKDLTTRNKLMGSIAKKEASVRDIEMQIKQGNVWGKQALQLGKTKTLMEGLAGMAGSITQFGMGLGLNLLFIIRMPIEQIEGAIVKAKDGMGKLEQKAKTFEKLDMTGGLGGFEEFIKRTDDGFMTMTQRAKAFNLEVVLGFGDASQQMQEDFTGALGKMEDTYGVTMEKFQQAIKKGDVNQLMQDALGFDIAKEHGYINMEEIERQKELLTLDKDIYAIDKKRKKEIGGRLTMTTFEKDGVKHTLTLKTKSSTLSSKSEKLKERRADIMSEAGFKKREKDILGMETGSRLTKDKQTEIFKKLIDVMDGIERGTFMTEAKKVELKQEEKMFRVIAARLPGKEYLGIKARAGDEIKSELYDMSIWLQDKLGVQMDELILGMMGIAGILGGASFIAQIAGVLSARKIMSSMEKTLKLFPGALKKGAGKDTLAKGIGLTGRGGFSGKLLTAGVAVAKLGVAAGAAYIAFKNIEKLKGLFEEMKEQGITKDVMGRTFLGAPEKKERGLVETISRGVSSPLRFWQKAMAEGEAQIADWLGAEKVAKQMRMQKGFFDFPDKEYASGGIVERPTNALIGEAGAEAVIPLKGGKVPVSIKGGGGATVSNYNFSFPNYLGDKNEIIRTISNALRLEKERTQSLSF